MVDPKASRFWQAGVQSGLIDAEALGACWDAIPEEKRAPDQVDRRLARQAVQAGLLTLWQAQQLLAGRSTGFKIDRYILLDMIGQGGMGRVYLAKDSRLNRRVALKILSPERVNNPRAIQRFQREARVGAQLQHEHLVRIYDEGESNGKCYLVMEFIEGKNLGALIAEHGPMAPATAARLTRQVALGLEHAQLKGLIHRDVNPYNILMTRDGVAKLTDLGLAIDLAEQVPVTRDGATVGTFDYVSPEQARHSHSVDTRSDIYSLGCTLYHLLSGQVPFPSPSLPEKLFGHQAVEPEPLTALVPGIPEGLSAIVQKMMRKSPEDRYATPLELAQALEPYIGEPAPGSRDEASPASSPSASSHAALAETRSATDRPSPAVLEIATPTLPAATPPPVAPPSEFAMFANLDTGPKEDLSGLGLGLNFGPAPALSEGTVKAKAKPAPEARAPAPAPEAKPRPAPAPPSPAPAPAPFDFGGIGEDRAAPADDLSGLGLGLDFGPAPALSEGTARPKAKAKPAPPAPEAKAKPVEPAPPPAPAPPPEVKAKPAPAPAPSPPPAVPMPDFTALAGDEGPKEDLSGLGLGLNFGPAPPLSESKPKPKPKPTPPPSAPPPTPAPAPEVKTKPAAPPAPAPEPAVAMPDLSALSGDAPARDDPEGLGLGLDFGPAPALSESKAKPKPKPAPPAPVPAPEVKASPAPPPPPPAPAPVPEPAVAMPDFSALSGDAPAREDASGLGLGLNFGPEPPLSESKAPPRPKAKPAAPPPPPVPAPAPPTVSEAPAPPAAPVAGKGGNRRLLLIGGAAAALLLIVGGVVASGVLGGSSGKGKTTAATGKTRPSKTKTAATPKEKADRDKSAPSKALVAKVDTAPAVKAKPASKKIEEVPRGEPLAVRSPDGTVTTERGFKSAMQRAIGSKGHVLLNNRSPVKFAGDDAKILIGGGPLYIRAAEGVQPVLEVEIKGNDPFIMTRTDTPITLVGVTVVVRYTGQDDKREAPALIEAGGNVTLERCSFRVVGSVKGSRAVTAEGVNLTARGCWFEGFDKALDVAMFAQSTTTVTHCMMVRAKTDDSPLGWALRVRDMPGGPVKSGRKVILTNCTARGKGFLDVVNFSADHPLKVEVKDCAVQADALLAWETPKGEGPLNAEALTWTGTGNQYDLRGKSWVVLGPDGAAPLPDGPADLTGWTKLAKQEVDTVPPPIKFASEPTDPPQPSEFAIPAQGIHAPGADPAKIGPTAPATVGFGTLSRPKK